VRHFDQTDDRFGSITGLEQMHQHADLFDHIVGAREQRRGLGEAERRGGLKIDREPALRQRLYWHVGSAMSVQRSFVPRK
jgi:hypothetical protein